MQKRCENRLLPNTPADADAFGSHGRVADSIAEVVEAESGGTAIGLEGRGRHQIHDSQAHLAEALWDEGTQPQDRSLRHVVPLQEVRTTGKDRATKDQRSLSHISKIVPPTVHPSPPT